LISDDLSELRLSDSEVVAVFLNVDLRLLPSRADVERFERVLLKALHSGVLSTRDFDEKWCRQRHWRNLASLPTQVNPQESASLLPVSRADHQRSGLGRPAFCSDSRRE
jgi:hypothetical protein